MKNMKSLIASIAIVGLVGLAIGTGAGAADVTATVTPQNIAVSVSPATQNYGILSLSASNASRTTATSVVFTATNDGNVNEDFVIKGSNSTNGTPAWTLNFSPANTGTVSGDTFVHRFDADAVFTDGTAVALSTSNLDLGAGGIIPAGTQDFVLQMNMPTSSTDASSQQSTTVTVVATASS